MYTVDRFGPVARIRMAKPVLGRAWQWVHAFWVDGLLIDSGCRHTVRDLLSALQREGLRVTQLVNTHTHEDHTAGNAAVRRAYGVTPKVHPLGLERLARPESRSEMPFYRRFVWGLVAEPVKGEPLGTVLATERYRFQVIFTPGHGPDHVALFEENEGWLFTGDLLISPRLEAVRPCEDPVEVIASLKRLVDLPAGHLFCSHAYKVPDSTQPLRVKQERWERLREEAGMLSRAGLTPEQITRRLLPGRRDIVELISLGDLSRLNLIKGLLRGGDQDVATGTGG